MCKSVGALMATIVPYNATCSHMTFMNAYTVFIVVHIICVACELHHPF